jgi:hypothetical protein
MSPETGFVMGGREERSIHFSISLKWGNVDGIDDELRWLAHTLSVFSRRITRRILCVSLCCSNRASPVPRSFHSFPEESNRKSFARLSEKVFDQRGQPSSQIDLTRIDREEHVQLEDYGLVLFVGPRHDFFRELDDGFKVGIMFVLSLSQIQSKVSCAGMCGREKDH